MISIDLQPLLSVLSLLTEGRVYAHAEVATEEETTQAWIPIMYLAGPRDDQSLRTYIQTWLKERLGETPFTVGYERFPVPMQFRDRHCVAVFKLSWGGKSPEESGMDRWNRQKRSRIVKRGRVVEHQEGSSVDRDDRG